MENQVLIETRRLKKYFFGRDLICNNSNKCSFQEVDLEDVEDIIVKKNGYIRKERWYEKYYKNSRPMKS